jgi:C-terminal processing protease CtpA/Prc
LSNDGTVVLTTHQFFTPSGKAINKRGVLPNICTEYDKHDKCAKEPRADKEEDITTAVDFLHEAM